MLTGCSGSVETPATTSGSYYSHLLFDFIFTLPHIILDFRPFFGDTLRRVGRCLRPRGRIGTIPGGPDIRMNWKTRSKIEISAVARPFRVIHTNDTEGAKIRLRSRGSPRDPTDTVSAAEQPAHWMRERAPRFWLTARIGCFVTPMKFGKRCEKFGPTRNMDFPSANLPPRHHYRSSQTAGAG